MIVRVQRDVQIGNTCRSEAGSIPTVKSQTSRAPQCDVWGHPSRTLEDACLEALVVKPSDFLLVGFMMVTDSASNDRHAIIGGTSVTGSMPLRPGSTPRGRHNFIGG